MNRPSQSERPHGRARYVLDGCPCEICKAANTAYEAARTRKIAYGQWQPYVDATPIRAHVQQLQAAGLGYKRIARLAGVTPSTLGKLLYGIPDRDQPPSAKVRPSTAEKLFAVVATPDVLGSKAVVDATGTRRRLQALVAIGWSMAELGRRLNMSASNFASFIAAEHIIARNACRVRDLYEQMWDQAPPEDNPRQRNTASRARNHARNAGWPPPMAWDDDTIDLPESAVDQVETVVDIDPLVVERCLAGQRPRRMTSAERREVARRAAADGVGPGTLSALLHCNSARASELLAEVS